MLWWASDSIAYVLIERKTEAPVTPFIRHTFARICARTESEKSIRECMLLAGVLGNIALCVAHHVHMWVYCAPRLWAKLSESINTIGHNVQWFCLLNASRTALQRAFFLCIIFEKNALRWYSCSGSGRAAYSITNESWINSNHFFGCSHVEISILNAVTAKNKR